MKQYVNMRIILGLILGVFAFIGAIWFSKYSGSLIPYPNLLFFAFLLFGLLALWLIFSSFKKVDKIFNKYHQTKIDDIRKSAERITINFDLCEFRDGSFYHEVKDENAGMINLISPAAFSYYPTTTERVTQSSLMYRISENRENFISHSFPFDSTSLKAYVFQNKVVLFISRSDRTKYFFELQP